MKKCERSHGAVLDTDSPAVTVLMLVAAAVVLRLSLWRAVLTVRPDAVRVEPETPADVTTLPAELIDAGDQLEALGFTLLGTHSEKPPLRREELFFDYLHRTQPVLASLSLGREDLERLTLLTRTERGFVVTSNFKRPAREVPGRTLSGGLDGASIERVFKAHVRRVPELGPPVTLKSIDDAVEAVRAWFATSGKPESRQRHAVGLLWTLFALGMVGAAFGRVLG